MTKQDPFKRKKEAAIKKGLASLKEQKIQMLVAQIKRDLLKAGRPVPNSKQLRQLAESNIRINAMKK